MEFFIQTLKEEGAAIAEAPWSFFICALLVAAVTYFFQQHRYAGVREQIAARDDKIASLKEDLGSPASSSAVRHQWSKAKFRNYSSDRKIPTRMRLNQWALLLSGFEPTCDLDDDPMDMPSGVYSTFKALKEAAREGKLQSEAISVSRRSEVDRDVLRAYFEREGEHPMWLFPSPLRLFRFWRY